MKYLSLTLPGGNSIPNPPGLQINGNNSPKLGDILSSGLNVAFTVAGFLMFIWMAVGIFQYIFAGGNKEKLAKARSRISWAIIGFIFVILSFTLSKYLQEVVTPNSNVRITPISNP